MGTFVKNLLQNSLLQSISDQNMEQRIRYMMGYVVILMQKLSAQLNQNSLLLTDWNKLR